MPHETLPPDAVVHRIPRSDLAGICFAAIVLWGGAAPMFWLMLNEPRRSLIGVAILGVLYGATAIWFAWTAIWGLRHRLVVTSAFVRSTGLFATRQVRFADVKRVVWTRQFAAVLEEDRRRLRIGFGWYGRDQDKQLAQRLRAATADRPEEGWSDFEECFLPVPIVVDWSKSEERFRASGIEYRYSKGHVSIGVLCLVLFGLGAVVSFGFPFVASECSDEARENRGAIFLVFVPAALGYCGFAAMGGWLLVESLGHRLVFGPDRIRLAQSFAVRDVGLADVTRVVWNSRFGSCGSVVLHHPHGRLKIPLAAYDEPVRGELVHLVRWALADRAVEGWDRFETRCMPFLVRRRIDPAKARAEARRMLRFLLTALALALPFFWGALVLYKLFDDQNRMSWTAVALGPVGIVAIFFGLIWAMVRSVRSDLAKREVAAK